MKRYHVQNRDDYVKYNTLRGMITRLANELSVLPVDDAYRQQMTDKLLSKLVYLGLLPLKRDLSQCERITVSSFCRRRLPVVMVRLKMSETLKEAIAFVEQGHVRVGLVVVTDPAYFVSRTMEDHVTWIETSKIRRKILDYAGKLDDFDVLN